MSGRIYSLKRRDPDDLVFDLQNVSLSPPKRLRVSEPGVPGVAGSGPTFTTPQPTGETPFSLLKGPSAPALSASTPSTPLCSDTVLSPPPLPPVPVTVPASESKALVLYRPVNPPLFPGGPPYGSVDLSIALKMNSSMLPRPQGTDTGCDSSCFQTTSSDLARQLLSLLTRIPPLAMASFEFRRIFRAFPDTGDRNRRSEQSLSPSSTQFSASLFRLEELENFVISSQTGNYGANPGQCVALDLSGGPSLPVGQRRLTRNSSCPRFSSGFDDLPMIEEVDDKAAQLLQVIPWVPNTTSALFAGTKPIIEEINDGPFAVPDAEEMADAESMEVVSDDIIVPEVGTSTIGGQFGSPLQTFSASPWPQYEALQPQLPKVMWSH